MDALALERIVWSGRLEEPEFLNRIWELSELPSYDGRFPNAAGDVWQHRVNNHDWDDDWIFSDSRLNLANGPDELFLAFLVQMVHPRVREDQDEIERLVRFFNESLAEDGWELYPGSSLPTLQGGRRRVFEARPRTKPKVDLPLDDFDRLENPEVLQQHLRRIDEGADTDPAAAIGSSKELVESVCQIILNDYDVAFGRRDDVGTLYKKTAEALHLKAESVPDNARGSEAAQRALRALVATVQSLAELRNELGLGHGRPLASQALSRHARLAATAARAVTEFLLETWHVRRDVVQHGSASGE